jgi:DNA-binding Lrp family transcriptional regulator
MDLADLRLLAILNRNSKIPYRELADKLCISVQAVHKRVQDLTDSHVIACFTADLSIKHLKAVPVGIYGISKAKNLFGVLKEMGNDDSTSIVHGSGDFVFVMALLRALSDLEPYVEFVKKTLSMETPTVSLPGAMGFSDLQKTSASETPFELSQLDYRIILSLHKNARKEIAAIAQELGISAATVKRRLARLIDARVVDFSTDFNAGDQNGFLSMVLLKLISGVDRGSFLSESIKKFGPRIIFMAASSNLADTMSVIIWSASMKDSRDMETSFKTNHSVESCNNYHIQYQYRFPTWREDMLEQKADEASR